MATLPDLSTGDIGFIAYWNAIDQGGVGDIEPDEVLNSSLVNSHTIYDNGIEGDADLDLSYNNDTVTFRVKEDGWMVVYMDRTNEFNQNVSNGGSVSNWVNIISDWSESFGGGELNNPISQNRLTYVLDDLRQQFTNSGSMTYNDSDVSLYNYEYSTSTTVSLLLKQDNSNFTAGFSYTAGTTLNWVAATGSQSQSNPSVDFEGVTITDNVNGYGVIDVLGQGLIPNSGTEYQHNASSGGPRVKGCVLALWE